MAADGDGTPTGFHECHEDGSGGSGMAVWPGTVGVDGKFFFFLFCHHDQHALCFSLCLLCECFPLL